MRTIYPATLLGGLLFLLSTPIYGQILHQFSWNDATAPPTQADVGPNATAISSSAGIISAGGSGTPGLAANPNSAPKLDVEMNFPAGPSADVAGIDISFQYNRQENSGTTLVRGAFTMGKADGLDVVYQVQNPDNTTGTVSSPLFATARDGVIDTFRFTYNPDTGIGRLFQGAEEIWTNDGPDGLPLAWTSDTWILGNEIDASGEQPAQVVFDELVIREIAPAALPAALPVELIQFRAEKNGDGSVRLDWRTGSERDNDYFAVERSPNGADWTELTRIPGRGTTGETTDYTVNDPTRATSVRYYRLRQVDYDGTQSFSEVVTIAGESGGTAALTAYPNPTTGHIDVTGSSGPLHVYDAAGREITASVVGSDPGERRLSVNLSGFPAGLYLLRRDGQLFRVVRR